MKTSVFIDSNIWFSAFYNDGVCFELLLKIRSFSWDVFISELVLKEVIKNIQLKIPRTLSFFIHYLKENNIVVLKNPPTTHLFQYKNLAEKNDLPILVSAIEYECAYFITGNSKDFKIDQIKNEAQLEVMSPSDFLKLLKSL